MAVTAFLSYSWEHDEDHRRWVRDLAARLRQDTVETRLDQWHAVPGDQLPAFMERAIRENDFVLVVCTPEYKRKSDSRTGGVGYEGDVMTAEAAVTGNQRKFIPVLRKGEWTSAAPSWMLGKYYIDLRGDPYPAAGYEELVQTLLGTRPAAPPVGLRTGAEVHVAPPSPCDQRLAQTLALADATQWLGNILVVATGWSNMSSRESRMRLDIARVALDQASVSLAAYRPCNDPQGLAIASDLLHALKRLVRILDAVVPPLHERRVAPPVDDTVEAECVEARNEVRALLPLAGRSETPAKSLLESRPSLHAAFATVRDDTGALYRLYGFPDRQAYIDAIDPSTRVVLTTRKADAREVIDRILLGDAVTDVDLTETGISWETIDVTVNALLKDKYVTCDYGTPATFRLTDDGRRVLPNLLRRVTG